MFEISSRLFLRGSLFIAQVTEYFYLSHILPELPPFGNSLMNNLDLKWYSLFKLLRKRKYEIDLFNE